MNGANGGEKNCEAILRRAMSELVEREDRLQPFVDELAEVKRAIGVLSKALDKGPSTKSGRGGHPGRNPRANFTAKVVETVRNSLEPLAKGEIAQKLGCENGAYLDGILNKAVERNQLQLGTVGYELPSPIDVNA